MSTETSTPRRRRAAFSADAAALTSAFVALKHAQGAALDAARLSADEIDREARVEASRRDVVAARTAARDVKSWESLGATLADMAPDAVSRAAVRTAVVTPLIEAYYRAVAGSAEACTKSLIRVEAGCAPRAAPLARPCLRGGRGAAAASAERSGTGAVRRIDAAPLDSTVAAVFPPAAISARPASRPVPSTPYRHVSFAHDEGVAAASSQALTTAMHPVAAAMLLELRRVEAVRREMHDAHVAALTLALASDAHVVVPAGYEQALASWREVYLEQWRQLRAFLEGAGTRSVGAPDVLPPPTPAPGPSSLLSPLAALAIAASTMEYEGTGSATTPARGAAPDAGAHRQGELPTYLPTEARSRPRINHAPPSTFPFSHPLGHPQTP